MKNKENLIKEQTNQKINEKEKAENQDPFPSRSPSQSPSGNF